MACATRMRGSASAAASAIRFSADGDFGLGMDNVGGQQIRAKVESVFTDYQTMKGSATLQLL